MVLQIQCPHCQATLRLREEYGGKNIRCPKCQQVFHAPILHPAANTPEVVSEPATSPPAGASSLPQRKAAAQTVPCPACGEPNPPGARRCRACQEPLEEAVSPRRRKRSSGDFKPCPRCGCHDVRRVTWTFWGSFYGPALFCHVRCLECGYAYNGRTGRSNLIPAILFVTIPAVLLVALVVIIIWLIRQRLSGH